MGACALPSGDNEREQGEDASEARINKSITKNEACEYVRGNGRSARVTNRGTLQYWKQRIKAQRATGQVAVQFSGESASPGRDTQPSPAKESVKPVQPQFAEGGNTSRQPDLETVARTHGIDLKQIKILLGKHNNIYDPQIIDLTLLQLYSKGTAAAGDQPQVSERLLRVHPSASTTAAAPMPTSARQILNRVQGIKRVSPLDLHLGRTVAQLPGMDVASLP